MEPDALPGGTSFVSSHTEFESASLERTLSDNAKAFLHCSLPSCFCFQRPRRFSGRAKGNRADQGSDHQRRPSVGALVFELPGRTEERWLGADGESEPAGEVLLRF